MDILDKIEGLEAKFHEVSLLITDPSVIADQARYVRLNRDYHDLERVLECAHRYKKAVTDLQDAKDLFYNESDAEMKEMAKAEIDELEPQIPKLEEELKLQLLPQDPEDGKNVVMEIRGGTGGDEAAIFAGDLFRMYTKYFEIKGFKYTVSSFTEGAAGGYKEIIFNVTGENVYGTLKYESGAHRVQRVPVTESGGRIHTSAATVAVLPEAEEVDVAIDPKDLRIDTYCASGAGGQYVNRTETAIRITHLPTGIVVQCQDEKSQLKNKEKAMKVLRARLKDKAQREQEDATNSDRRSQVGSGDRSERIRTYNFPQGRVTDHRIGLTVHRIDAVLGGDLDEILAALITADQAQRLKQVD